MPLEMFDGKTGPRLIARLPVAEGSFADVVLAKDALNPTSGEIRLVYAGANINGYPALTPVATSLQELIPQISARLSVEQKRILGVAESWEEMASTLKTLGDKFKSMTELNLGGAQALILCRLDQARAENAAEYFKRMGTKPPICPRIMPGAPLVVKMPRVYRGLDTVLLGTVRSISIHNKESTTPSS